MTENSRASIVEGVTEEDVARVRRLTTEYQGNAANAREGGFDVFAQLQDAEARSWSRILAAVERDRASCCIARNNSDRASRGMLSEAQRAHVECIRRDVADGFVAAGSPSVLLLAIIDDLTSRREICAACVGEGCDRCAGNGYEVSGSERGGSDEAPRELLCMVCKRDYPVWFAPNHLWNAVMRDGDGGEATPFICPTCFALAAEAKGVTSTAFVLSLESSAELGLPPGESLQRNAVCDALSEALLYIGNTALEACEREVVTLTDRGQVRELARLVTIRDPEGRDGSLGENTRRLWWRIAQALNRETDEAHEREICELIAERDRIEKQIQQIHIALGGDGEFSNLQDPGEDALDLIAVLLERGRSVSDGEEANVDVIMRDVDADIDAALEHADIMRSDGEEAREPDCARMAALAWLLSDACNGGLYSTTQILFDVLPPDGGAVSVTIGRTIGEGGDPLEALRAALDAIRADPAGDVERTTPQPSTDARDAETSND